MPSGDGGQGEVLVPPRSSLLPLQDVEEAYQQLLLRQPPPKGHSTAQTTPGQGSVSPELSRMLPSPRRGSRASRPSLSSSPQSPVAAKPGTRA